MQLYKRNGIYYASYQSSAGRQTRRSLATRNKQIARQLIAKLELEIHEELVFGKEPKRYFKDMLAEYLEAKQQTKGFERSQHAVRPLVAFFGDCDASRMKEVDVEKYCAHRVKKVKAETVRREIGVLSAAFNHAVTKLHWSLKNPCKSAAKPKKPKGRVRWITHSEATKLIAAAKPKVNCLGKPLPAAASSTVLADFIELALNTGCRKGELLSLQWDDVDLSTRLLKLQETKSGEWQTVPINEQARQVLVRRMKKREASCPSTPFVFFHETARQGVSEGDRIKDLKKSFTSACKRAGIKDFRIHDLRHTFASWLVRNGTPLLEVSKLLRHSSTTMTERYAHLAPDQLHQAAANLGFTAQSQHSGDAKKPVVLKMA